jgi:hypothetical protein
MYAWYLSSDESNELFALREGILVAQILGLIQNKSWAASIQMGPERILLRSRCFAEEKSSQKHALTIDGNESCFLHRRLHGQAALMMSSLATIFLKMNRKQIHFRHFVVGGVTEESFAGEGELR